MIKIQSLEFAYPSGGFHLNMAEFHVDPGEKLAVIGPSGSGKTTLLNLLSGIIKTDHGSIRVADTELDKLSDAQRRDFRIANVGMVFQQFELVEYLDARNNILLPFAINRSLKLDSTVQNDVESIARNMGLGAKLKRRSGQLSQGEQQRVAICRALITNPNLILADEPTGNLDPKNKSLILELIFHQAQERGQTLVVVTHDMGILGEFDRVIDFEQFRVVSQEATT